MHKYGNNFSYYICWCWIQIQKQVNTRREICTAYYGHITNQQYIQIEGHITKKISVVYKFNFTSFNKVSKLQFGKVNRSLFKQLVARSWIWTLAFLPDPLHQILSCMTTQAVQPISTMHQLKGMCRYIFIYTKLEILKLLIY